MFAALIGLGSAVNPGHAQPANGDAPGAQVLTRGPVHEAFAGMITYNPEPGITVKKAPPEVIEEVPPAERPAGDNVAWIPGYWAWDDERNDFLWISGTWRALPPGRAWMAGYWGQTRQGQQWTPGYWADATVQETTYLPPPPASVEAGPNVAAPSADTIWTPGSWIWLQGRYAWQPGYWTQVQADWDWIPAHYVWTPRGTIFVEGFWDYPIERRGILFAPVYFQSHVYSRRGYYYSPLIVINLSLFNDHLFLRPRYQHYYFGDYYAASYSQGGYYASYSFQSSRYGYDPFYSRERWVHRQDREWAHRVDASYQYRRANVAARPPQTWAAQIRINSTTAASQQNRLMVAAPIEQLARSKDSAIRFQPVANEERQQLVQRRQDVQSLRDQRRTVEATVENPAPRKPGAVIEPVKVPQSRSPIVARPASQLGRNQAPPTAPQAPQAPRPEPQRAARAETAAPRANGERTIPQPEPRRMESETRGAPGRGETVARERQAQAEAEQRAREAAKAQEEAQRNARAPAQRPPPGPEHAAQSAPGRPREDPNRNARGMEKKAQHQPDQNPKAAAAKAQEEAQRKAKELEENTPGQAAAAATEGPAPVETGPVQPMKKGRPIQPK